jgi:hypothetical protein
MIYVSVFHQGFFSQGLFGVLWLQSERLAELGAVSMVEMTLNELQPRGVVDFDPERRAAMVSNLLVVLCGESEARPVINTGTLYH